MPHFFSINSVQFRSRPWILKCCTIRIQSKFNKISYSPDPAQSKSSPMLISARNQLGTSGVAKSFLRGTQNFQTMSNTFFQGGEKICRGLAPPAPLWLRSCYQHWKILDLVLDFKYFSFSNPKLRHTIFLWLKTGKL